MISAVVFAPGEGVARPACNFFMHVRGARAQTHTESSHAIRYLHASSGGTYVAPGRAGGVVNIEEQCDEP